MNLKKNWQIAPLALALIICARSVLFSEQPAQPKTPSLLDIYATLKTKQFVDLTHAFGPGIPHWPGFPDEQRETLYYYDEGVGSIPYDSNVIAARTTGG